MSTAAVSCADNMLELVSSQAKQFSLYTELRAHNNYSSSLAMRKGTLLNNSISQTGGVSARSHYGGYFGFCSSPSTQKHDIGKTIAQAQHNAKLFGKKSDSSSHQLPQSGTGTGVYDYRTTKDSWSATKKVELIKEVDHYIKNKYSSLLSWDVSLAHLALEKALVTSDGAQTYSYVPRSNLIVNLSIDSSDGIVQLYNVFGGFGDLEDVFENMATYYQLIDSLYDQLRFKAEGVHADGGYKDVVLDPDLAGILAHEAIGHTVEADLVLGGSVAGDNLNKQVASELFTLIDGPERGPDGKANFTIHVDDEGTPCRETVLIEDGTLKSFLHNKESARRFGVEPTGNARAYQFSDEPLIRMRNTYIKPGQSKLDDMISSIDDGYYLIRSSNGQADATSEFMFGVIFGYEIKKGKLGRAIKDATVSGIAFDMLKTITHVSEDLSWSCGGMCGKKQWIPVGMGGPAIKCKIHLGGR